MNQKEFAPCFQPDCRVYDKWIKVWDDASASIAVGVKGRKTLDFIGTFSWCVICTHFNKTDNFLKKEKRKEDGISS